MQLPLWFQLAVPIGGLAIGLTALLWARHEAAKFDRRYGKRG
ncbi:hypothetical protein GCM10008171_27480 [Methylopila jiangsuensis]|uniref:Uncharacterized protein n=1 Tax=Methylopila jiangsuensis TaxID=586230 RepID=A0A9W6JKP2_9HYPH|nr:hypothetical protein [Methylopila jiangsuensis]MDR6285119.1 hypothetical protein [Methylopila jiangsuensis]GLK77494.1 hypothetical protein GCM10008171_27480 [Methylopila jiangsuensis]